MSTYSNQKRAFATMRTENVPGVFSDSAGQAPIVALVDKILAAKRADPNADVSALEAEIDRLVYSLYGLAREEIAIIEESLQEWTGNRAAAGALAVKEDR